MKHLIAIFLMSCCAGVSVRADEPLWKKHVVWQGARVNTAVGGDFTGDKLPDVVFTAGGKTRLMIAPDWREVVIDESKERDAIHSELFDVDRDGDLDYIGARYQPGLVFWLETPKDRTAGPWRARVVDDQVNGVHGLLKGDVDGDGHFDLLANSAQPVGPFPESAVWLKVPADPHAAASWTRHVFADRDAPGLSHYLGFGDVDGDGRPDIAMGAKGGNKAESVEGAQFAWWHAPADPTKPWTKYLLATHVGGATNIQQADVNGDGRTDFIATRGHQRGVVWFEPPAESGDWAMHDIDATIIEPHSLQVLDLDGDGDIDAATCAYGDAICKWYENDGRGKFTTHVVARDQAAYDLRALDMDRDGDLDLLVAGQQSENVAWYENAKR